MTAHLPIIQGCHKVSEGSFLGPHVDGIWFSKGFTEDLQDSYKVSRAVHEGC